MEPTEKESLAALASMENCDNSICYIKLQKLRSYYHFTHRTIAEKLNLSTSYYWQLENRKKNLYYDTAVEIAKIFCLKPDDIFY